MSQHHRTFGGVTTLMLGALGFAILAAIALFFLRGGDNAGGHAGADIFVAKRGNFDITIPCSGELAAQNQIEIRNKLESRAVITYIVPEGTFAKAGDILLTLAEEEILNKVKDAEDQVKTSEADMIAAQAAYDIAISERDSDLAKADVDVQLAELALQSWAKGELLSKRQELATALETAEINFKRMTDKFAESQRLLEDGFISKDECDRDEIELIEARAALDKAKLDQKVYEEYTFLQDQKKYESDLEQAKAERDRVKQRHDAELERLRADVESKKHQLASKRERLAIAQREHSYCKIVAPADGLVVYNTSLEGGGWRGMEEGPPQVGTELRPNERVMVLPDTTQMMAVVKVNEALSSMVKPGQRAIVTSDAVGGATMVGEVKSVGVLAEQGGWRDPNRRDYSVKIHLKGGYPAGLKPSMRCEATIYVDRVDDVLHVPVQAVFRSGGDSLVYVPAGSGYAERLVSLGRSSELAVEVIDGLQPGDSVLLRKPALNEIVSRLPRRDRPNNMPEGTDLFAPTGAGEEQHAGAAAPTPGGKPAMAGGQRGEGREHTGGDPGGGPRRSNGERTVDAAPVSTESGSESAATASSAPAVQPAADGEVVTDAPATAAAEPQPTAVEPTDAAQPARKPS